MDPRRTTVRDVRRGNRSVVLTRLFFDGPLSRQELSVETGLSPGTISTVAGDLLDEHLVVEAGSVESDGGRPRVLLKVNPRYGHLIGVDVGETRIRVEAFDLSLGALATIDHPLASTRPEPDAVVAQILAGLDEVVATAGIDPATVLGMGIGVSGTVEHEAPGDGGGRGGPDPAVRWSRPATGQAVVYAQTLGWEAVPFGAMLRAGTAVPLFVDNGAKTLGQAELWFGAGRGARHAVITLIGSGVGAAVITNGTTYRGTTSSAGEWGHTTIEFDGRACRCGSRGCLEAYIGAGAILDRYREAGGVVATGASEEAAIAALLADGSPAAAGVLDRTAAYLGAGIANLVNLFNPERIVVGGWAGLLLGERLLPQVREEARARALRHPFGQASIEICRLGPDAVALGAATLPVADLLSSGTRLTGAPVG